MALDIQAHEAQVVPSLGLKLWLGYSIPRQVNKIISKSQHLIQQNFLIRATVFPNCNLIKPSMISMQYVTMLHNECLMCLDSYFRVSIMNS